MSLLRRRAKKRDEGGPGGGHESMGAVARLADGALDCLAGILRALGQHPIDLKDRTPAEVRDLYEAWARHVLIASEPPEGVPARGAGERQWIELERSVRELRQAESAHVSTTLAELRHVVWAFIGALSKASTADERSDDRICERLDTLRVTAQTHDVTELRREVSSVISLLDSHIEARRARHQSQVNELSDQLRDMKAAFVREREAAQLDALTRVSTRGSMDEHIADICQMAKVVRPSAIAILMDVDHFKWVNDKFGHSVGDDVLQRIGAALRQGFRRRGDFVARYGGDEFVAIIEEGTVETATMLAESVMMAVREIEASHEDEMVRVSMSVGIAALRQGDDPRTWLERADRALYVSKEAGRDCVRVAPD